MRLALVVVFMLAALLQPAALKPAARRRQGHAGQDRAVASASDRVAARVLAQVLLKHGATQDALEIAEHVLSLAGALWTLATWLRDECAVAGEADRVTRAALVALRQLHSLDDYQAFRTVAARALQPPALPTLHFLTAMLGLGP